MIMGIKLMIIMTINIINNDGDEYEIKNTDDDKNNNDNEKNDSSGNNDNGNINSDKHCYR